MKFLIISGNPKSDGLCRSIEEELARGARDGGADVDALDTNSYLRCQVCGDGWGTCRERHECVLAPKDGFDKAQAAIKEADALCVVTPVYWGEMAEGLKSFLDRFRRCEFIHGVLAGKPVLLVASPGGSGNGLLTCLEQMDRFCRHTGAVIFDYIGVNRWNQDYKRAAAYAAAKALAEGRKAGETYDG
ncbi:MAG: flavodoxin family protein [Oscillospiraceae bacterium]|jgi:multimeric flavodoxin WrbA|nr:flavodoxin family protein [Oscillospiraceae bacterium]